MRRAHPAHRMSQYGPSPEPYVSPWEGSDLEEMFRELATTAMASETPGVASDELADEIIGMARKWVEREDRNNKFKSELDPNDDEPPRDVNYDCDPIAGQRMDDSDAVANGLRTVRP